MSPEDPRHGTVAGYNRIPCRDRCCKDAMAKYKKVWEWDAMNGRARIVSAVGTRRRIEALMALGWSGHEIGRRLGSSGNNVTRLRTASTLTAAKAAQVALIYNQVSMKLPTGNRQAISNVRNLAKRRGYLPPLAWDDDSMDNPLATPTINFDHRTADTKSLKDYVDPVVIERILTGDGDVPASLAEKREVVRRWAGSHSELARLTGWKVERYLISKDAQQTSGDAA